jgi:hypothetical protein
MLRRDELVRKVPRLPGVSLQHSKKVLPLAWGRHLQSLPELRKREREKAELKTPDYNPSGALLDVYLSTQEPNLYRRLLNVFKAQERSKTEQ